MTLPITCGGVLSIFMFGTTKEEEFPALSVAVPVKDWLAPSVETTVSGVFVAMPDRLSAASKCNITSVLYHPLFPMGEVVMAPEIEGGVLSIFTLRP